MSIRAVVGSSFLMVVFIAICRTTASGTEESQCRDPKQITVHNWTTSDSFSITVTGESDEELVGVLRGSPHGVPSLNDGDQVWVTPNEAVILPVFTMVNLSFSLTNIDMVMVIFDGINVSVTPKQVGAEGTVSIDDAPDAVSRIILAFVLLNSSVPFTISDLEAEVCVEEISEETSVTGSGNDQPTEDSSTCENQTCTRICTCPSGFTLGPDGQTCEDVDECLSSSTHNCSDTSGHALCVNSLGSCQCMCDSLGYIWSGTACEDVDECAVANGGCEHTCVNNIGSFECRCNQGYKLEQNRRHCEDVDECISSSTHNCSDTSGHALCVNSLGSYQCMCDSLGYIWDGSGCQDVDECDVANGGCEHTCVNNIGSFECRCNQGYKLGPNGKTCGDFNECEDISTCSQSSPHHICLNEEGSFTCDCDSGYAWEDRACQNQNECNDFNGGCQHICTDTEGSFACSCYEGYVLNNDQQSCKGGSGIPVKIRFNGNFRKWMSDIFSEESRSLARTMTEKMHIRLRERFTNRDKMIYDYIHISGFENGSVLVRAELIFRDQLTDFQVSYVTGSLGDALEGLSVTTDGEVFTLSDTETILAVRKINTVNAETPCSVVESEALCGEHRTCQQRDNEEPTCGCSGGLFDDNCTLPGLGEVDGEMGDEKKDDGNSMTTEFILMMVISCVIPVTVVAVMLLLVLRRKRASRTLTNRSFFRAPYSGVGQPISRLWLQERSKRGARQGLSHSSPSYRVASW